MRLLFVVVAIITCTLAGRAQCCSPGNPVGGTASAGVPGKNTLRVIGFYRYSYSEKYFEGHHASSYRFLKDASYNYSGLSLAYGLGKRASIETELGYFINKVQRYNTEPVYTLVGNGFNNAVISVKYAAINIPSKNFELTAGAGIKLPFSTELKVKDNVVLPQDIQSSTLATGEVGHLFLYKGFTPTFKLFVVSRAEFNNESKNNYRYGNSYITSVYLSKDLNYRIKGILQVRNEVREKDSRNGREINSSGGNLFYVSPQLSYSLKGEWYFTGLVDVPVFRHYNGIQIGNQYAVAINCIKTFKLKSCNNDKTETAPR